MDRIFVALASLLVAMPLAFAFDSASPLPGAGPAAGGNVIFASKGIPPSKDMTDWALLTAYEYAPGLAGLSDELKALEGKTITMRGFLMTISQWDDITEFCLVPNHMSCCFGMPAGIQSMVHITLRRGERGLPNTTEPLEVKGVFRAVETKDDGILLSIYRLDDATARIIGY